MSPTATRTYLEMREPSALRPAPWPNAHVRLDRIDHWAPSFWRYLYTEVGRSYRWIDRLPWTDDQIAAHLSDPATQLWLLTVGGTNAGYFELHRADDGAVEIAYFGLLPEFVGHGYGKSLLSAAVTEAWGFNASRVWLHTSTLDHPSALPNYLARGFRIFKVEEYTAPDPPAVTPPERAGKL